jgi:hypothetical protein
MYIFTKVFWLLDRLRSNGAYKRVLAAFFSFFLEVGAPTNLSFTGIRQNKKSTPAFGMDFST